MTTSADADTDTDACADTDTAPDTDRDPGAGSGADTDIGAAPTQASSISAALSTQPVPPPQQPTPRRRVLAPAIRAWRWLTSMRTALILLFLLALAAVPGSLLPQRSLNPDKVRTYLAQHATLGPLLDHLGLFAVFASPWFAAIYLLLFISLVGCLVPRIRLHARALRGQPPKAPRRFERLPETAAYDLDGDPAQIGAATARLLRRGRWRVVIRDEAGGVVTVCAEKGYLRETGNLVFHVALTGLLIAVAVGQLWGYTGSVVVEEGQGFCNTVQQFDSFRPGHAVTGRSIAPYCVHLERFTATYEPDGTAAQFRADITYSKGLSSRTESDVLRVNHPLRVEGTRLYLLGHGFAPVFTVRDPSGQVFRDVSAPFLPQDGAFASQGALKLPDAKPHQLALDGLFAPTGAFDIHGLLTSVSPKPDRPLVAIFIYRGNLGVDTGRPQSVYAIDRGQLQNGALKKVGAANLQVGQGVRLADGTQITFAGYKQWANLQVSRDPAQVLVLLAAVLIVIGLLLSLRVRRRRLWVRVGPSAPSDQSDPRVDRPDEGRTVMSVGGLARTDAVAFGGEFESLSRRLLGAACTGAPAAGAATPVSTSFVDTAAPTTGATNDPAQPAPGAVTGSTSERGGD
ncbi:MAG: cytochrome c biogenesis protein ResB [Mycobacteriales bacterium]